MSGASPGTCSGAGEPSYGSVRSSAMTGDGRLGSSQRRTAQSEGKRGCEVVARQPAPRRHEPEAVGRPACAPEAARCRRSRRASRRSRGGPPVAGLERTRPAPGRGRAHGSARRHTGRGRPNRRPAAARRSPLRGTTRRAPAPAPPRASPATSPPRRPCVRSDARYARMTARPQAASTATPQGRPARISRTIGPSMSRGWFPGSSYVAAQAAYPSAVAIGSASTPSPNSPAESSSFRISSRRASVNSGRTHRRRRAGARCPQARAGRPAGAGTAPRACLEQRVADVPAGPAPRRNGEQGAAGVDQVLRRAGRAPRGDAGSGRTGAEGRAGRRRRRGPRRGDRPARGRRRTSSRGAGSARPRFRPCAGWRG